MQEKEPQFGPPEEKRQEISLEQWVEEQTLDLIIRKTRAKRLRMEDCTSRYGKDEIAKDRSRVERLKATFKAGSERLPAKEQTRHRLSLKRGEALEAIIAEQGELSEWFGPNAMTARATEFDDFVNKVDIVIEFAPEAEKSQAAEENMGRIAFGIDASDNPSGIAKKIAVNRARIAGKLPPSNVKYFRSQVTDYKGPLERIVPVVVGLEGKNMADLVRLQGMLLSGVNAKETSEQLASHPAQRVLVEEIAAQLKWYMRLLEQEEIAHATYEKKDIEGLLRMMEELLKEKKSIPLGELGEDRVWQKIQEIVR